jgi:hypothetical protein
MYLYTDYSECHKMPSPTPVHLQKNNNNLRDHERLEKQLGEGDKTCREESILLR